MSVALIFNQGGVMRNFLFAFLLAMGGMAHAETTITVVPTAWVVKYFPAAVVYGAGGQTDASGALSITKTGSKCYQGMLTLPAGSSADDLKVLFQLVTTAKLAGSTITIAYDETSSICTIVSFGAQ